LASPLRDRFIFVLTGGRGGDGDYGTANTFTFDPSAQGFSQITSTPFTDITGGGPDAGLFRWKGYGWCTTESGGTSGLGGITAYNYSNQTLQQLYNFPGGNFGSVPTGNLVGSGSSLYGAAAYDGAGGHGLIYSLQPCAGTQSFQAPLISAAIYNSRTESLLINYSGSVPTSAPNDPTMKMWATIYDATGTSSPLKTFDLSTKSGGSFTDTYRFRTTMMPSAVSLSFSSLCGESALSAPATVSLAPELSFTPVSGHQLKLSWPASSIDYSLQSSPILGRSAVWTDLSSPAPVLSGSQYSVTVTPGIETTFYRLGFSF
jgi:uncharacterized repeat protein (TIGR03803 family)